MPKASKASLQFGCEFLIYEWNHIWRTFLGLLRQESSLLYNRLRFLFRCLWCIHQRKHIVAYAPLLLVFMFLYWCNSIDWYLKWHFLIKVSTGKHIVAFAPLIVFPYWKKTKYIYLVLILDRKKIYPRFTLFPYWRKSSEQCEQLWTVLELDSFSSSKNIFNF